MIRCIPFLLLSVMMAGDNMVPPPSITVPARVVNVVDGDTVDVVLTLRIRVRLLGVNAPELNTEAGRQEKKRVEKLALNRDAVLHIPLHQDLYRSFSFGRVLGTVYIDGKPLGKQR